MVSCPACGHENRRTATFCGECAAPLVESIPCPSCGVANPVGQKFCDSCGRATAERPLPGGVTPTPLPAAFGAGRYLVRGFLGEGSRKRVYLAHDTRLERDVAIALIKTEGLDEAGLGRVRREARAMGRLGDHPNVVTIYDVGDENGQPYIVSQYMAGGAIQDLLEGAEKRRLPIDDVLSISLQVCRALEHVHERRVIHRDVKPGNVWLTQEGAVKLGDFGLALALDRSRMTLEGMMVGTVAYMPPEQALGRSLDDRSDLYSFGAMLYEMVTGRPPFLGDDAVAVISQHLGTAPVAPSWHNPDVPRALEALILALLAKPPEKRPDSAGAVCASLEALVRAAGESQHPAACEEENPLDRLATGVFVGREREMDELRAGLEEALSGHGRLVMLVGEPGIGKTRTAEELATYAQLRRAQVLWGRCYEGEGAPAYWPWVQAVRAYVHDCDPDRLISALGSGAVYVGQMVSEVRERLPGLPEPQSLGPEEARFRLFDGVTHFLGNAANQQPLVLVLDDLHWADKPSLLLLQFLARELRRARVLIVGSYRDEGLGRQHPLAQTLAALTRDELSQRILLRGLSRDDVGRFIEITAGLKPPSPLVEAVYRETEGNPFFVNEVVRLLVTDGRLEHPEQVKSWSLGIPQGVREVLGRRLDRLSAECNRVLGVASVIGREFALNTLQRSADVDRDRLLDLLDEALAAKVITELPRSLGHYSFTHALIRETLYEELSTAQRTRLHRVVGATLRELYEPNAEPHLAELAHHFLQAAHAGDAELAIAYSIRAAERAAAQMAHEEAARHYEKALQALELEGAGKEVQRCKVLLALSEAAWRAGEYQRGKEAALSAAQIARTYDDAESFARAALGVAGGLTAFAAVTRDEAIVGLLEEALQLLGREEDPLRARLLARLAEEVNFMDPKGCKGDLIAEALEMARALADPNVLAYVLRVAQWVLWGPENLDQRIAWSSEVIELAQAAGDRVLLLEGRFFHLWDMVELGNIELASEELEVCRRLAGEVRQPYLQWAVAVTDVLLAFARGRLAEVEKLANEALRLGQEAENPNATIAYGFSFAWLQYWRGEYVQTETYIDTALPMYPAIDWNLRTLRAVAVYELGREAEARAELEALASRGPSRNLGRLPALCYLSVLSARLKDVKIAQELYGVLMPFADLNVVIGPVLSIGPCSYFVGLLARSLGWHAEAVQHFEAALEMSTRIGTRQAFAQTCIDFAEMLLEPKGDRSRALELLNQGLEISRELGLKGLMEKALALKLSSKEPRPGGSETWVE